MCGERVPQEVRIDVGVESGTRGNFLYNLPNPLGSQLFAVSGQKDFIPGLSPRQMNAFLSQILIDRVTSDPSNRYQSSFGTFANDPDDTFVQVQILKASAGQFADPQPRRIKQLENCAISQWKRPALNVDFQETIHLHLVQGLR